MRDIFKRQTLFLGPFAAVTLLMGLVGCSTTKEMSALGDGLTTASNPAAATTKRGSKPSGYVDPMVANAGAYDAYDAAEPLPEYADSAQDIAADLGETVMQATAVKADQSSIFSAYQATGPAGEPVAPESPASLVPSGLPRQGVNASAFSLFSAQRPVTTAMPAAGEVLPLE